MRAKSFGFTLLEISIVLVIVALLVSLITPNFVAYQRQKNLQLASEIVQTSLTKSFFSSRSRPLIFGVKALGGQEKITIFSCSYPDCSSPNAPEEIPLPSRIFVVQSFEVLFLPPHGDISPTSFTEEFSDITVQNVYGNHKTLRVYKNSGLIELLP